MSTSHHNTLFCCHKYVCNIAVFLWKLPTLLSRKHDLRLKHPPCCPELGCDYLQSQYNYSVILPQNRLKNILTSCQKYEAVLSRSWLEIYQRFFKYLLFCFNTNWWKCPDMLLKTEYESCPVLISVSSLTLAAAGVLLCVYRRHIMIP